MRNTVLCVTAVLGALAAGCSQPSEAGNLSVALSGYVAIKLGEDSPKDSGFGHGVAIDGDIIVVGHPGYNDDGRLVVYRRTEQREWRQEAALANQNLPFFLGLPVAIKNDLIVAETSFGYHPEVYAFRREQGVWSDPVMVASGGKT